MQRIIYIVLFSLISTFVFAQTDSIQIVKAFEHYKLAVKEANGDLATSLVSQSTLDHYQHLMQMAKSADSLEISMLSTLDKLTVLSVRQAVHYNQLSVMSGKAYFTYAITNGIIENTGLSKATLGEVIIDQQFATAQLVNNGTPTTLYFSFVKENRGWKLDITPLLVISNEVLMKSIEEKKISESTYIHETIQSFSGKPIADHLWQRIE